MIISLCIIAVLLLVYYWYKRPSQAPPGPRGLPILGMIPFLTQRPEIKFFEWGKKYGPVLSVRVGQRDWVVLNDAFSIKDALIKHGINLAGRPPNHVLDEVISSGKSGIAFSDDDRWKTFRKFGEIALRNLGIGRSSFENNIMKEIENLLRSIKQRNNEPYSVRGDVSDAIHRIMCVVLFGEKARNEIPKGNLDYMEDPYKGLLFNMAILLPFLRYLPPVSKVLREYERERNKTYGRYAPLLVKEEKISDLGDILSFVEAFASEKMSEIRKLGSNLHFTKKQFIHYAGDMFIAGVHTTTSVILWCLLGVLHYQCYQEKVRSEINKVIGNKKPFIAARNEMPFTMAYLQEVFRYCTPIPLTIPHCSKVDINIEGYNIAKGTQVMINLWSAHNDPSVFKHPEIFRPERFIDKNGNFTPSKCVIPFSVGSRHCMGEQLARMEVFLFFVSILQNFHVNYDETSDLPGLDDGVLGIVYLPKPYKIAFKTFHKSE